MRLKTAERCATIWGPVEISEDYNRVHAMFEECLSKDHKVMEGCKGVNLKDPYFSTSASYGELPNGAIADLLPTSDAFTSSSLGGIKEN